MTYLLTGHRVSCDYHRGCPAFFDDASTSDGRETRRRAALEGWQTGVPQQVGPAVRASRLDFCPQHAAPGFVPTYRATAQRGVCARCGKDRPLVSTRRGVLVLDAHTPVRRWDVYRSCPGTHEPPLATS